jgi:hypothetical protein
MGQVNGHPAVAGLKEESILPWTRMKIKVKKIYLFY